jgi:hypothetical protein
MAKIAPFETHPDRYEDRSEVHRVVYVSELLPSRALVFWDGRGPTEPNTTAQAQGAQCC